jgi:hypothetical protein
MTTINITMMCLPNFYLNLMKEQQDTEGKEARKELRRRKMVGFYISCQEEKANFEAEMEEAKLKILRQEDESEEEGAYGVGVKKV